jgi:hypothetical protein
VCMRWCPRGGHATYAHACGGHDRAVSGRRRRGARCARPGSGSCHREWSR